MAEDPGIFKERLAAMKGMNIRPAHPDPSDADPGFAWRRIRQTALRAHETPRFDESDFVLAGGHERFDGGVGLGNGKRALPWLMLVLNHEFHE
jgi:hypothetical protein